MSDQKGDAFLLPVALGVPLDHAREIADRTFATFKGHGDDMGALCKTVAGTYDPDAILVGSLIERVCTQNDRLYAPIPGTTMDIDQFHIHLLEQLKNQFGADTDYNGSEIRGLIQGLISELTAFRDAPTDKEAVTDG